MLMFTRFSKKGKCVRKRKCVKALIDKKRWSLEINDIVNFLKLQHLYINCLVFGILETSKHIFYLSIHFLCMLFLSNYYRFFSSIIKNIIYNISLFLGLYNSSFLCFSFSLGIEQLCVLLICLLSLSVYI